MMTKERKIGYYAYCLECCGGGKALSPATSKKNANIDAVSHLNSYGHKVVIHYGNPNR